MIGISKGPGIPRAQLREQKMKVMVESLFKPIEKPTRVRKEYVCPYDLTIYTKKGTLRKNRAPLETPTRVIKEYDLSIYTKKGKLRKNLAPLDRTYKSKTHVRVQSTGEILTRAEWKSREKKRIYQLRIDSMQCVRCGKSRECEEFITCKSCNKQSRILYNKKASV